MTIKELVTQLQQKLDSHLEQSNLLHQATDQRIEEVEEWQTKIQEWINWGLKIILSTILLALLSLVVVSRT